MMYAQGLPPPMSEKRILALLGFLLGLLSAVLIVVGAVNPGGNPTIDLAFVVERLVEIVLAVVILLGSLLIYRGKSSSGGLVNLVVGLVALFLPGIGDTEAVLAIVSGILGFVASESR